MLSHAETIAIVNITKEPHNTVIAAPSCQLLLLLFIPRIHDDALNRSVGKPRYERTTQAPRFHQ
jgi:hypothetical protein